MARGRTAVTLEPLSRSIAHSTTWHRVDHQEVDLVGRGSPVAP